MRVRSCLRHSSRLGDRRVHREGVLSPGASVATVKGLRANRSGDRRSTEFAQVALVESGCGHSVERVVRTRYQPDGAAITIGVDVRVFFVLVVDQRAIVDRQIAGQTTRAPVDGSIATVSVVIVIVVVVIVVLFVLLVGRGDRDATIV